MAGFGGKRLQAEFRHAFAGAHGVGRAHGFVGGDKYEGLEYPTVEHAFQAAKTTEASIRKHFTNKQLPPSQAKRLGRDVPLRSDWDDVKLKVMEDLIYLKFTRPYMVRRLLDTGNIELIEGNYWGDTYWGIDLQSMSGENHLGKILMKTRDRIKEESKRHD